MKRKSFMTTMVICILSMLFANAILCSCSDNEQNIERTDIQSEQARKCFTSYADYENFLMANKNAVLVNPNMTLPQDEDDLSIIESFVKYTTTGAILNRNLEFQIGKTIYKYGKSGYTIYEIEEDKYKDALVYAENDEQTIKNKDIFESTEHGKYLIAQGVTLYYDGNPVIDIQKSNHPLTRVSMDGRTKVQAAFWKSKGVLKSSCGVKVEAWQRDNIEVDFSAADTDLELIWDIRFNIPAATMPNPSGGSLTGHGNIIKEELYWCGSAYTFNLISPSIITGRAKCWDGSWITANVKR